MRAMRETHTSDRMDHKDMNVDGISLHVEDSGTGAPVLLLHGWPDTSDLWRYQMPALARAGFRAIAPDLRGFGRSGKPEATDAYAITEHVGDLLGILDQLGVQKAHVVGHDWGAAIGWVCAALAPDRVASLTALAVGHPGAFANAGWKQRGKSWYMLLFQFPAIAERWLSARDFAYFRSWSGHPDVNAVVARLADPAALTASLGIYRANLSPASPVKMPCPLPPVTVPVLGVWASEDRALTEVAMTGSADHVTGPWRYERLDGLGHWMQLEDPEAVNRLLLGFLHQAPAPART